MGNSVCSFVNFINGKSLFFNFFIFKEFFPFKFINLKFFPFFSFNFFLGSSLVYRNDFTFFFNSLFFFSSINYSFFFDSFFFKNFFFLNIVVDSLAFISASELGCFLTVNSNKSIVFNKMSSSFIYLLGTDLISMDFSSSLIVYQGFFDLTFFLKNVFLFLPVSSFVERVCFFINLEGRLRKSSLVFFPSFYSFSDSEIFRSFFYFKNFFIRNNFSILDFFYFITFFFFFFIDYTCLYFFKFNLKFFKFISISFFSYFSIFFCKRFLFINSIVFRKNNF